MRIKKAKFRIVVTIQDVDRIRNALRKWKKDETAVRKFNGIDIHNYLEAWKDFVDTDWTNWSIYEYLNDITCRYWIQIFIENVEMKTKKVIDDAIEPIDTEFKRKMEPLKDSEIRKPYGKPFLSNEYFWETHTIQLD